MCAARTLRAAHTPQVASGEQKQQGLREAREEARRSRQEEKRKVDEMRSARQREARRRVLFKRRRALYSSLPDARRFFAALITVQSAIRARRARKLLLRTRIKRGGASLAATPATSRAAAVGQARFRSWSLRADLVATEHALGVAAYSQPARAAHAAPLEALLLQLRSEAAAARKAAEARREGLATHAADALGAERDMRQCEARRRLLEAVQTRSLAQEEGAPPAPIDAQLIARAQAQLAREVKAEATSAAAAAESAPGTIDAETAAGPELVAHSGQRPPPAQQQQQRGKKLGRSEVEAALMRHSELATWACSLQGATSCVEQLHTKHEWAPPLLLAQAAHLHAACAT